MLSISPLVSNPSCEDTFFALKCGSHSYLPIICLLFAVSQDGKEGYEKWRVENSWGDDRGNKGNAQHCPCKSLMWLFADSLHNSLRITDMYFQKFFGMEINQNLPVCVY